MARIFEFHAYAGDGSGVVAATPMIETHLFDETAQAKAYAGRLAKRVNGPVDIAMCGDGPWDERYITTAQPSYFHATGFRFERLA